MRKEKRNKLSMKTWRQLKGKLAGVLSASMVLGMMMPAIPAYAGDADITFDLGLYNEFEGKTLNTLTHSAMTVADTYTDRSVYPIDTVTNGQNPSTVTGNNLELPWWDADWRDNSGTSQVPTTPGTVLSGWGTTSGNYNFEGYLLRGWTEGVSLADNPTATIVHKIRKDFPYGSNLTYYANYVADPAKTYTYTIVYEPSTGGTGGTGTPLARPIDVVETGSSNVLVQKQFRPIAVPGYTVASPIIEFAGGAAGQNYGFEVDGDKNVNGAMVNKNMKVTYKYDVDPAQKFNVTINHEVLRTDGSVNYTNTKVVNKFSAGADIVTSVTEVSDKIVPDTGLITPDLTGEATHLLVGPLTLDGGSDDASTYILSYETMNNLAAGAGPIIDPTTNGLAGKMPNQNITVTYQYTPNPAYSFHIPVTYYGLDNSGRKVNITDLVNGQLGSVAGITANTLKTTDSGAYIQYAPTQGADCKIGLPDMSAYGYQSDHTISYQVTDGIGNLSGFNLNVPGTAGGMLEIGTVTATATLEVVYTTSPTAYQKLNINKGLNGADGNGTLEAVDPDTLDVYDPSQEYNNTTTAHEMYFLVDGSGNINIDSRRLPKATAEAGYKFDGYYKTDFSAANKVWDGGNTPTTITLPAENGQYKLIARFIEDEAKWKTFRFSFDGVNGTMVPAGSKDSKFLSVDASGALRVVDWSDMEPATATSEFLNFVPDITPDSASYVVKWYDSDGIELTAGKNMNGYPTGSEFRGYCVSIVPEVVNTPTLDSSFIGDGSNGAAGEVSIQVDPASINIGTNIQYVVVDANGKVAAVVDRNQLVGENGVISGNLAVDTEYRVYEYDRSNGTVGVGDDVSANVPAAGGAAANGFSSPAVTRTPVCADPVTEVDPNHTGRTQIVINPVSPNTQYGLLDENGNEVYPWTNPSSGQVIFDNLNANENYQIVARPDGSTVSTTADPAAGGPNRVPVTTDPTVSSTTYKVTVAGNEADLQTSNPGDLNAVAVGTEVTLTAKIVGENGFFTGWRVIYGNVTWSNVAGTAVQFIMPSSPVVVQPVYTSTGGNSWDDAETGGDSSIGAETPVIDDSSLVPGGGNYRVQIKKATVSDAEKAAIAAEEGLAVSDYTGLYSLTATIQKEVSAGVWVDCDSTTTPDLSGEIISAYVEAGAIVPGRTYLLHEFSPAVATASEALQGNVIGGISPALNAAEYQGVFKTDMRFGYRYILGYTTATVYTVQYNVSWNGDAQTDTIPNQHVAEGEALSPTYHLAYENTYMPSPNPDSNGLTWTYKGLSEERGSYLEYDLGGIVTGNMTLWMYYENDAAERAEAESALEDLYDQGREWQQANAGDLSVGDRTALENTLDLINDVLNQTVPRKATTSELQAKLDELKTLLDNLKDNNDDDDDDDDDDSNNGGGSGGSGGGGGNKTSINGGTAGSYLSKYTTYRVGTHGHWNNLDAVNHIWEFVLNDGSRLRDTWANVSYTPPGGSSRIYTYHFGEDGIMDAGWYKDADGAWYYLSEANDGYYGRLILGWHHDRQDGKWYYLGTNDGIMRTGWQSIGSKWYFLTPGNNEPTWRFEETSQKWMYTGNTERPFGSMYESETTPDQYVVGADGAWLQ